MNTSINLDKLDTSNDDEIEAMASSLNGTSAKIRFYTSLNYERSEIAKKLGIRYQHVRNVQVTQLKRDIEKVTEMKKIVDSLMSSTDTTISN